MWLFKRKTNAEENQIQDSNEGKVVKFEPSVLRKNNITRLSIDERWTKLFVPIKISPEIDKAEKEMGELIKSEAMLNNEQDNLEPKKRKLMKEIMELTEEAFEKDNKLAKKQLAECRVEIERINSRINDIMEDMGQLSDQLKTANIVLLEDSIAYIFSTLKTNREREVIIRKELEKIEQKEKTLREELETISVDWTQYAEDLTEIIGADEVKRLELEFGLEEIEHETSDTSADESD